jgi:hypothetical protein
VDDIAASVEIWSSSISGYKAIVMIPACCCLPIECSSNLAALTPHARLLFATHVTRPEKCSKVEYSEPGREHSKFYLGKCILLSTEICNPLIAPA